MKLASTWADHQPAFFMATHQGEREIVVAIRGTAQLEDVVTDLTALPEVGSACAYAPNCLAVSEIDARTLKHVLPEPWSYRSD